MPNLIFWARPSPEQSESLQLQEPSRDDDARNAGSHAQVAGEDGGIDQLNEDESERLRHRVFAEESILNMSWDTDFDLLTIQCSRVFTVKFKR